jgi:CRP/FNR family cyclic AMP-dependent transcriptional regulator
MNAESLHRLLEEHPFFSGIDNAMLDLLVGCAKNEAYRADEHIFREGGDADRFYIIRHGAVSLEIYAPGRDPIVVESIHEGEVLGWSWIAPPYKWFMDARAAQLCRVVSLDARCLRGKMENDHELGYEMYRRFMPIAAKRLNASRLQMIDIYGNST